MVSAPGLLADRGAHRANQIITRGVADVVVDPLDRIEVDRYMRRRLRRFFIGPAVPEARQRIDEQFAAHLLRRHLCDRLAAADIGAALAASEAIVHSLAL